MKWDTTVTDIEIFDTRFIGENVYSGDDVDPEHRRALHKFVLGAANVALAAKVDDLDARIRDLNAKIAQVESVLAARLRSVLPVDDFLNLAPDPQLDEKLRAQEARVRVAQQASEIASTPSFVSVTQKWPRFSEQGG
jgi:wobble nucleotide-excising tRNase